MSFETHPYLRLIDAETHARPVPPLEAPLRIRRVGFFSTNHGADLQALHQEMAALAGGGPAPDGLARQLTFERDGRRVTWERHNEFATLTWTAPITDSANWPEWIGLELHRGLPMIFATRVDLLREATVPERALAGFNRQSLAYSRIFEDSAEAATDFVRDADGFTRFEVAIGESGSHRQGVIVRRLLEIETYRVLALMGLPRARELGGVVTGFESRLRRILKGLAPGGSADDLHDVLGQLHDLSVEVGQAVERTSFRFAATLAYGAVLDERLSRLRERAINEHTTIQRFTDNRVHPALSTCRAMEKRLSTVTEKVQGAIELLEARISLSIQNQNKSLLDSLSETARSQFRLQQTVEGLSIIAISYYAIGLLGYVYQGVHDVLPLPKETMVALSVPVVVAITYFAMHRIRRHMR
jgi:uncharacterized membrane-anchored protein